MKKFLMTATVPSMIGQFNMSNIQILLGMGYEVHVACNFDDKSVWNAERVADFRKQLAEMHIKEIQIEFARTPYDMKKLIKAYRKLRRTIKEQKYAGLHCHTPVAGMISRFAALGTDTKVIYTAHGFHFFKGAPLKNWLLYYPVEKICSYMTDVIITINKEDYALAQKKLHAKKVEYIPGVGIDLGKFEKLVVDKRKKRQELEIPETAIWMLNIGELIPRKNQETLIRAVANIENVYLTIAGRGTLMEALQEQITELGVDEKIKLLGFRRDIVELCKACDIFAFPSFHEGLPVSVMEAMAAGLPVVCSRIRGNTDLVDEEGGVLFNPKQVKDCQRAIEQVIHSDFKKLGKYNMQRIREFEIGNVNKMMLEIYKSVV